MRTLVVLTIVALAARALAGADASAAARAKTAAPAPGENQPHATVAAPRDPHRRITSPSTFAMGVATLAGLGVLHWRRRRFVDETAAL